NEALFYVEFTVKDRKLGLPLGLSDPEVCSDRCPEMFEAHYALRSKQSIRNNLVAFKKLFFGCGADNSGVAVDDLLAAVGAKRQRPPVRSTPSSASNSSASNTMTPVSCSAKCQASMREARTATGCVRTSASVVATPIGARKSR